MIQADDADLSLTRVFEASPEQVFDAWLSREAWQAWLGPEGVRCEVTLHEPRVGGAFRLQMRMPDGNRIGVAGVFRLIDRPRALQFTWGAEGDASRQSTITLNLVDLGGKTELKLRQQGAGNAGSRDAHADGWRRAFDKLDLFLR